MYRTFLFIALAVGSTAALKSEEPPAAWNFKSAKANEALRKYQAARKKLDEAHEKSRRENREALIAKLQEEVKAATQANNLDDALAIRDAIKALSPPEKVATAKEPKADVAPNGTAKPPIKASMLALLLGDWKVSDTKIAGHLEIWTFNRNGTVQINMSQDQVGVWRMGSKGVDIRWQHLPPGNNWNTLNSPLNRETVTGDSFTGAGVMRANKITPAEAAAAMRNQPKSGRKGRN